MNIQQANAAAVASKVVNQTAKKIAKEAIKDTVVDMSFNMVINYKYVPKDERIKAKEGFELICLPKDKSPTGDCSSPKQISKSIDKNSLDASVERKLDQKIAGGIGATKWGKFLDWFVPVFSAGLGLAMLDYSINGDVSDLWDEIAYESLTDEGLLISGEPLESSGTTGLIYPALSSSSSQIYVTSAKESSHYFLSHSGQKVYFGGGTRAQIVILKSYDDKHTNGYILRVGSANYIEDKTDVFRAIPSIYYKGSMSSAEAEGYANWTGALSHIKIGTAPEVVPMPNHSEVNLPRTTPSGTPKKILAPGAFPMEETGTSTPVYPYQKPDGTTGFKTTPDSTTGISRDVNEDNVTVKNPTIITNPDGSTTVKKAPTLENPNPSPSEDGTIPPPKDPNAPPTEFPEGETCSATLKLPKILPLFNTLSESFPFSIPWDLKSGFDALFAEMGKDKPKFSYKFNFNGSPKEWKFELPAYFDTWKPFTDSMLIFVFDVGILYGIYRLMQGGGS